MVLVFRAGLVRLPERASLTTSLQSYTVDRFAYKFNKHISYLMHTLRKGEEERKNRECFDRPGPPSTSTCLLHASSTSPRANPTRSIGIRAHRFLHLLSPSKLCAGSTGGCCLLYDCL